jgi:hypothetical protein
MADKAKAARKQLHNIANGIKNAAKGYAAAIDQSVKKLNEEKVIAGFIEYKTVAHDYIQKGIIDTDPYDVMDESKPETKLGNVADSIFTNYKETIMKTVNAQNYKSQEVLDAEMKEIEKLDESSIHLLHSAVIRANIELDTNNTEENKVRLYVEVRKYIRAIAHFGLSDITGISIAQCNMPAVNEAAKDILSELKMNVSTHEEAEAIVESVKGTIDKTPDAVKKGWTGSIMVGLTKVGGLLWDFAKGAVFYVYNGIKKVIGSIIKVSALALSCIIDLLDAATTKDFGASGAKGIIRKGMMAMTAEEDSAA